MESTKVEVLAGCLREHVEQGSHVITGGLTGYSQVVNSGYTHAVEAARKNNDTLPHVHRVFFHMKRWILGTRQEAISREHLECYLDEFVFRFNRRKSKNRILYFHRLLENAVRVGHVTTVIKNESRLMFVYYLVKKQACHYIYVHIMVV
jgi:transposase-like protein